MTFPAYDPNRVPPNPHTGIDNQLPASEYKGPPGLNLNQDIDDYLATLVPPPSYLYRGCDGHLYEKPIQESPAAEEWHSESCSCLMVLPENQTD